MIKFDIIPCPYCLRREKKWSYEENMAFSKNHCRCKGRQNLITLEWTHLTWELAEQVWLSAEKLSGALGPGYFNQLHDIKRNQEESKPIKLTQDAEDWPIEYNWVSFGPRGIRFYINFFSIMRKLLTGEIKQKRREFKPGAYGKYLSLELLERLEEDVVICEKLIKEWPEYKIGLEFCLDDNKRRRDIAKSDLND